MSESFGRSGGNNSNLRSNYKFNAMTTDEFRRRREDTQVEIRKTKREDSLNKRRNLVEESSEGVGTMNPVVLNATPTSRTPRARDLSLSEFTAKLPDLVQRIYSADVAVQWEAASDFRRALAKERNAPIQEVVDCGVVPRFVQMLATQAPVDVDDATRKVYEDMLFEAAWVLTNIASGEAKHTMAVVQAGAVLVFIALMRHHNADIREQCMWALGNIAGDGPELRDYVLGEHMMGALLENIVYALDNGVQPLSIVRNGAWAISNLARGTPAPSWREVVVSLPILFRLLQLQDTDTLVDTCWALAYMSTDADNLKDIVASGIVPFLVPLLENKNISVLVPALRAVGNIVTGDESQTQSVIDAGGLPLIGKLLNHTKVSLVKEACWALSNITAGTPEQIQSVLDANLVPHLVKLLSYADYKVKKEACWAICNATSAHESHPHQVKHLVSQGCIKPLCDIMEGSEDSRIIMVALDGLQNILNVGEMEALTSEENVNPYAQFVEEARGLDTIITLQDHPETDIYLKCKAIIDKFYDGEEGDVEIDSGANFEFNPNASVPQGGFNFS